MAKTAIKMAALSGGGISPSTAIKSTGNTNVNNTAISGLTVGKTYAVVYQTNNTSGTTVEGADMIGSEVYQSNGANWSANIIDRLFFIKATATSIKIINGSNSVYGVLLVQLD